MPNYPMVKSSPKKKTYRKRNVGLSKAQKKQVDSMVQRKKEKKYKLTAINATVDTSGILIHLTAVPIGTSIQSREGNVIFPYKMKTRLSVQASDSTNQVRCIIFKKDGKAIAAISDILDIASGVSPNQDYKDLFYEEKLITVVSDRIFNVTTSGSNQQIIANKEFKLKGKTQYTGSSSIDYGENQYYFLALSNSGAITHPNVVFESKILFTDS